MKSMKRDICMEDILLGMGIREKNKFTPLTIQILICYLTPKAGKGSSPFQNPSISSI
jgi:hypothetical protein